MKKISEVRVNAVVIGVLLCLLGTLFILRPQLSVATMGQIVAIGLGIVAVTYLIRFLMQLRNPDELGNALSIGVSLGICACFVGMRQEMVHNMVLIILAIVVAFDGAGKLQNSLFLNKNHYHYWWVILLIGLINTGLGVIALWNPFIADARGLIVMLGVSMLFSGVSDLVILIIITKVIRLGKESTELELVKEKEDE